MTRKGSQKETARTKTMRGVVRRRRKGVSDEAAIFARCVDDAEDFMMSHAAIGYPAQEVVELAAMQYGQSQWPAMGLVLARGKQGYDDGRAARFILYACKRVFDWRRTDHGKMNAKFCLFAKEASRRATVLGMWIGNPECRLLELQKTVARNRGRDDKTVVSALRAAADMGVETSKHTPVDAVRTLVDVAADKRQMFIVHMPKTKQPKP
jgi:hypothetical protein